MAPSLYSKQDSHSEEAIPTEMYSLPTHPDSCARSSRARSSLTTLPPYTEIDDNLNPNIDLDVEQGYNNPAPAFISEQTPDNTTIPSQTQTAKSKRRSCSRFRSRPSNWWKRHMERRNCEDNCGCGLLVTVVVLLVVSLFVWGCVELAIGDKKYRQTLKDAQQAYAQNVTTTPVAVADSNGGQPVSSVTVTNQTETATGTGNKTETETQSPGNAPAQQGSGQYYYQTHTHDAFGWLLHDITFGIF